jgi:hypothetical protein
MATWSPYLTQMMVVPCQPIGSAAARENSCMTGSDWDERSKQQECSFLKKRSKKLLDSCEGAGRKTRPNNQKFFASFF